MDAALIRDLNVGDVIEWGNAFPGMSDEAVLWQLVTVPKGNLKTYKFMVTWHGCSMGNYFAKIQPGDKVLWVKS